MIDLSPSFFLCFECLRVGASPLPAACSLPALFLLVPLPFVLPALLVVCRGVGRGGSIVPSCGAMWLVARRSFPMSVGGTVERLATCLRSSSRRSVRSAGRRVGVSILSAAGVLLASAWLVSVIGAGGGRGSSACLDEADGGVCGLCGVSFYRLITSVEAGILFLVP